MAGPDSSLAVPSDQTLGAAGIPEGFRAPAFRQRFPWIGGDLQTLRNFLLQHIEDLTPWPERRLRLPLGGPEGDHLAAALHAPSEAAGGKPLVVLIHGLTGCEDSRHIRVSAAHLLRHGYPVVRLNLRGAGPSRPLSRGFYHAGRSEDLHDAVAALYADEAAPTDGGLALIGFSLGANLLLKFLSEAAPSLPLVGAVSVSAPIDLQAAQQRIMAPRNRLYHRYLLRRMIGDVLGTTHDRAPPRSVYDFDDRVVAPAGGFAGAQDYYARCSADQFLAAIRVPTLILFAADDPWIPVAAYRTHAWSETPALTPVISERGGHVGFHGRGSLAPWHDRCALGFLRTLS